MKKIYTILALLTLSATLMAQTGRDLYNKYSDLPGTEAVFISPAMFRLIGQIPDVEFKDAEVDFSPIIKSMTGFYILTITAPEHREALAADVNKAVSSGKYELLMEAKDNGEVVRMYTVGDQKTVTSFVMLSQEASEVSFISFDGKMDRDKLEELMAQAAADQGTSQPQER